MFFTILSIFGWSSHYYALAVLLLLLAAIGAAVLVRNNVYISGAGHLSLTDLSLDSPILTNLLNGHGSSINTEYCLKTINKVCLEFFDTYLKGQGKFTSAGTY